MPFEWTINFYFLYGIAFQIKNIPPKSIVTFPVSMFYLLTDQYFIFLKPVSKGLDTRDSVYLNPFFQVQVALLDTLMNKLSLAFNLANCTQGKDEPIRLL